MFISAEKVDDVTEESITAEHSKVQARSPMERVRRSSRFAEKEETVVGFLQCPICPLGEDSGP